MCAERLYQVELRYSQPDCCVRNRFYWVQTSIELTAPDPEAARMRAVDRYQSSGKTEILRVVELSNEIQS